MLGRFALAAFVGSRRTAAWAAPAARAAPDAGPALGAHPSSGVVRGGGSRSAFGDFRRVHGGSLLLLFDACSRSAARRLRCASSSADSDLSSGASAWRRSDLARSTQAVIAKRLAHSASRALKRASTAARSCSMLARREVASASSWSSPNAGPASNTSPPASSQHEVKRVMSVKYRPLACQVPGKQRIASPAAGTRFAGTRATTVPPCTAVQAGLRPKG